ncbi:hypothetical protein [Chromobacterium phragmitis]|uniref:hypothetical protein n=1 Tax=Chromobacterium phragmitis TaxID=2202141 RepID=UPI003266ED79
MKLSASATIVSSTWAIRRLNAADIGPDWLDGFQRRQDVTLVYRGAPGDRRIATEPFIDDWSADERRALCPCPAAAWILDSIEPGTRAAKPAFR